MGQRSLNLPSYTEFIGKHEGETAFICGAGTSFLECYKSPRLDEIHDHVVVSVNSSFIAMPWDSGDPDRRFWISNDALCRWWSYWPRVRRAKANRIVRDSWSKYENELGGFHYFWPRPTSENIVNPEDEGLAYCSSIPSGIDLCIQMGVKRIFLLGVDQYMCGNKSHFWQYLPKNEQPVRMDRGLAPIEHQRRAFSYNNKAYPALKSFADLEGVVIYNCSHQSKVDVFDKISFEEALDLAKE